MVVLVGYCVVVFNPAVQAWGRKVDWGPNFNLQEGNYTNHLRYIECIQNWWTYTSCTCRRIKMLYCWLRRDVMTCVMLRPLRKHFRYLVIKIVAVTLVVTVSLMWHMQWTKKRLLFVFSANSLQSNLRFGLPSPIIPLNSAVNSTI